MSDTLSLSGSWGVEKRKELDGNSANNKSKNFMTTYQSEFTLKSKNQNEQQNKLAKFRSLQQSGKLVTYGNLSKSGEYSLDEFNRSNEKAESYLRDIDMGPYASTTRRKMSNANTNLLLTTADAPIAMGRSGVREEKGLSTSGLIGERLLLSSDSKLNTLAQRSWLYDEDPALNYKINGKPEAYMPNDVSLAIGGDITNKPFDGWNYQRRAVLTGDVFSRSQPHTRSKISVFLDDEFYMDADGTRHYDFPIKP
eukprot:gene6285-8653_t